MEMLMKKLIRKAQTGKELVTEKKLMPKWISSDIKRLEGPPSKNIDTSSRSKNIKKGYFREDPKSGDLIPTEKYYAAKKVGAIKKGGGKISKVKKVVSVKTRSKSSRKKK